MLIISVLLGLVPLVLSASSSIRQMDFRKMNDEGLIYSDHLLFDSPARSRLSCLKLCAVTNFCVCFTYTGRRGTPGTCRGHSAFPFCFRMVASSLTATTYFWTGEPTNVALGKVAIQSSNYSSALFLASAAVDGNLDPDFYCSMSCSCTQPLQTNWWQVDLGDDVSGNSYDVVSVTITNRGDCCPERLRDFDVHVYSENPVTNPLAPGALCFHHDGPMGAVVTEELVCSDGPIRGRFVRVTNTPGQFLTLCEVQVMAMPALTD